MTQLATIQQLNPSFDARLATPAQIVAQARSVDVVQVRQARGNPMPEGKNLNTGPSCFVERCIRNEEDDLPLENADFHNEWQDFWSDTKYGVIFAPVGHGKTHQLLARIIYELGKNPNLRVAIVCANDDQAKVRVEYLREQVENNARIHQVFPELRIDPRKKTTEHQFTLVRSITAKDPSVRAYSVGSKSITGARVDLLILDDVLDLENTETPEQLKKITKWFDAKAFGRLPRSGNGRVWVIGTPWAKTDLLHILEKRKGWKSKRYSAVPNNRQPRENWETLWHNVYKPAHAAADADSMHPAEFARTLLCDVYDDSIRRFKEAWISKALLQGKGMALVASAPTAFHRGPPLQCFTGVDLGVGQDESHDLTAIITIAITQLGRRRLVDLQAGRWTSPEIMQRVQRVHFRYQSIIGVESNAAQDYMRQNLVGAGVPVRDHHTGKNKKDPDFGLESLAVEMRAGLWEFPSSSTAEENDEEISALLQEMRDYRPRKHTGDRLIALWIAREMARHHGQGYTSHLDTQYR